MCRPSRPIRTASRDQRRQRRQVDGEDIIVGIGQPIALATARHVDRQHAMRRRQSFAQHVEIARVPSDAVHAYDDVGIIRRTPFEIDDTVKPVRRQAAKISGTRDVCVSMK